MKGKIGHALVLVPSRGWALPPGNVGGLPADIYRGGPHCTSRRSSPIVGTSLGSWCGRSPASRRSRDSSSRAAPEAVLLGPAAACMAYRAARSSHSGGTTSSRRTRLTRGDTLRSTTRWAWSRGKRPDADELLVVLDPATTVQRPVGGRVDDPGEPAEHRREVLPQVGDLDGQIATVRPPGPVQGPATDLRRELEAQASDERCCRERCGAARCHPAGCATRGGQDVPSSTWSRTSPAEARGSSAFSVVPVRKRLPVSDSAHVELASASVPVADLDVVGAPVHPARSRRTP